MTVTREDRVVVVGQGYVGLPLALRAVEVGYDVVGFDVDKEPGRPAAARRELHRRHQRRRPGRRAGHRPLHPERRHRGRPRRVPHVAVVCVPTPLRDGAPDLHYIEDAARLLGPHLTRGACVVLESTTYPGTTEEVFGPILEAGSGLRAGADFHLGYSPERIDPSNPTWGLQNTPKIVSGVDDASAAAVAAFYGDAGRPHGAGARHPRGRAGQAAGEHLPARQHRAGQRARRCTATSSASTSGR